MIRGWKILQSASRQDQLAWISKNNSSDPTSVILSSIVVAELVTSYASMCFTRPQVNETAG